MRFHVLQHVAFEGPAGIELWAQKQGHQLRTTKVYLDEEFPQIEEFDLLVLMGGPMSVNDDFEWLNREKQFVKLAIDEGKKVLGICLGAQLIANVLGAKVCRAKGKEIGWFPISLSVESDKSNLFSGLPVEFPVFHWHGETFDLPAGATRLASSELCLNQAFEVGKQILGLQFHLEVSVSEVEIMLENCKSDLEGTGNIQDRALMLGFNDTQSAAILDKILSRLVSSDRNS